MLRLWPDSLFGRLFMATCVPIVATLGLSYALVVADRRQLASRLGGSSLTVNRVSESVKRLEPLDEAARVEAIRQLNADLLAGVGFPGGGNAAATPRPATTATAQSISIARAALDDFYLKPINAALGGRCESTITPTTRMSGSYIDLARPPPQPYSGFRAAQESPEAAPRATSGAGNPAVLGRGLYDLSVRCTQGAPLHFRVPAPPDVATADTRLSWQLMMLAGMLAAVLFVMTRRLTAPLRELQRAADAVGRTQSVPRVTETGALEIRQSLRAFNTMQDRLRRYLDSRTRVLAAMSHDLRTPLTRLRLRAESIDALQLREQLVADIEEMDELVNRSLDLFRGLNEQEPRLEVDMGEFVANLADECRDLGLSLSVHGSIQNPALVRPLALKRALRNLVDNACKYGGGAELTLSDGEAVEFGVRDHGPGIPEEQLQAVLEPFNRLETSRNRDSGGVGLGLSIARDVAELHGGTLVLINAPGGGLLATMTLPREGRAAA